MPPKVERALDWMQVVVLPILAVTYAHDWYVGEPATFSVWFWCLFGVATAFFLSLRDLVHNDY